MNIYLRIALTMLIILVVATAWGIYDNYYPPVAGSMATLQLEDDNYSYDLAKTSMQIYNWLNIATWLAGVMVVALWVKQIFKWTKKHSRMTAIFGLMLFSVLATGCRRPYKEIILVEIEPNQTAFVVPLAGRTSDQGKFVSLEFLEKSQVATKRVEIEPVWHQTGHFGWQGKWIPSARVITVDRSPVTREWTNEPETGTSPKDDAFAMETRESIDFTYGGNVSALITEEDAATFLYRYSGKTLEAIMDSDIRGFMQGRLSTEFGTLEIDEARSQKGDIFSAICKETSDKFSAYGISITSCGASGGLNYTDPKIQEAITANFEREQEQIRAQAELDAQQIKNERVISEAKANAQAKLEAQKVENERIIAEAEAKAEAVRLEGEAEANVVEMIGSVVEENPGIVSYEIAKRSKGDVPEELYFAGDASQLPFPFFLLNQQAGTQQPQ